MDRELTEALKEHITVEEDMIKEDEIEIDHLSYFQLRDLIWKIGRVVAELEDKKIYIAAINSGFSGGNTAYLAIKLYHKKLQIVGYAKEGLFKQNTYEKAVKKLQRAVSEKQSEAVNKNNIIKRKMYVNIILLAILILLVISLGTGYCIVVAPVRLATERYNEAVDTYNNMAIRYDEVLSNACVDNIDGISDSAGTLKSESTNLSDIISTLLGGNSEKKIKSDTDTIYMLIDSMENDLKVVTQITNPSSDWVLQRLADVELITETAVVSEGNDPGQMLGKEGGYTACVYFAVSDIENESVDGNSVLEKGTDGGGSIEVYASVEDAEARCEYLEKFDGTLLYSGSYAIVGTVVVRTSYRLDGSDQLKLTNEITQAFTRP